MTDTTITPEVAPQATPDTPPPAPDPKPTPATPVVEHTPGGWPVVPLAVTGTNTTASLLATAALVGGPAGFAVAATGAAALGAVAATRKHRANHKTKTPRKARAHAPRSVAGLGSVGQTSRPTRRGGSGRVPGQSRNGATHSTGKSAGRGLAKSQRAHSGSGLGTRKAGSPKNGGGLLRKSAPAKHSAPGTAAGKSGSRAGQVKALRDSARTSSPSRAARRSETTGARRGLADGRRHAKTAARTAATSGKGVVGRSVGKATGRISSAKSAAVQRSRKARDQRTADTVAAQRDAVRKAPLRKAARKALRRSAARFQGRGLLAALLAGALGLVGMVTTPLGRKLGWAWLMYPGRRLYARLTRTAEEQRKQRDEAIVAALGEAEAASDAEAAEQNDQISDTAERPVGPTPAAPTTTPDEGENVSGFRFEEHAAEMETAAQQYDPENAMEILAMVEGLPAALTSVANVMQVLAERADSEFPLEKPVADGFNDIFGALMAAVAVAEDMGPLFRQAHEQDIARHEDPRNGAEAEKGWNV
ncbi:hypothetical protein AMK14_30270 [Streptomyces sp. TSRI0445]|uniref:hypothetical protein n=1 Tax=Streptomyces TaxID=1883 RepID=UPI000938EFF3|nr:hypothetical protein [Streptomyces sp. TSRI0445]OKI63750.1 hypothetical protein AMK14_30270 [Streptomyces sp. TSRI0445]